MAALVIKNLPDAVHQRLKLRALRNHRSLTKEAIALLEAAVRLPEEGNLGAGDAVDALFASGDSLAAKGLDFEAWASRSREVWR